MSAIDEVSATDDGMEPLFDLNLPTKDENDINPQEGEYWKVKVGKNILFAFIVSENPLGVKYFEPTIKGGYYRLSDAIFDVVSTQVHVECSTHLPNQICKFLTS